MLVSSWKVTVSILCSCCAALRYQWRKMDGRFPNPVMILSRVLKKKHNISGPEDGSNPPLHSLRGLSPGQQHTSWNSMCIRISWLISRAGASCSPGRRCVLALDPLAGEGEGKNPKLYCALIASLQAN